MPGLRRMGSVPQGRGGEIHHSAERSQAAIRLLPALPGAARFRVCPLSLILGALARSGILSRNTGLYPWDEGPRAKSAKSAKAVVLPPRLRRREKLCGLRVLRVRFGKGAIISQTSEPSAARGQPARMFRAGV